MKPIFISERSRPDGDRLVWRFPLTEWNYQARSYVDFQGGRCTNSPAPSFRNISRNYFREEARFDFVTEALLFSAVVFISAAAVIMSAVALIDYLRALDHF